jgi:uncharacterized protein (TIGR01777 family)
MKHIILAGGSGFIGTALANILHQRGYKVTVLSRKPTQEFSTYSRIQWDARSIGEWTKCLENAEAVIQLTGANVGAKRWSEQYKKEILESRIQSTTAIVNAINSCIHPPKTLISTSGVGFYGNNSVEIICNESFENGTDFLANVCLQWENATNSLRNDVRKTILRIGVVLDPNEGALAKLALPYKFFVGGCLGSGTQILSWIHRDDLVKIFVTAIENPQYKGILNASAPNPISMKEFSRTIGKVLKRPSIFPVPSFALSLLLGEMGTIVLTGQNAPPIRLQELNFQFQYENIEPTVRNLLQ